MLTFELVITSTTITYETTEVKTNKQGYIVAHGREICKGKPVGSIDGPYHVADIYKYAKKNVDNMFRLTGMASLTCEGGTWWTHCGTTHIRRNAGGGELAGVASLSY